MQALEITAYIMMIVSCSLYFIELIIKAVAKKKNKSNAEDN